MDYDTFGHAYGRGLKACVPTRWAFPTQAAERHPAPADRYPLCGRTSPGKAQSLLRRPALRELWGSRRLVFSRASMQLSFLYYVLLDLQVASCRSASAVTTRVRTCSRELRLRFTKGSTSNSRGRKTSCRRSSAP